MRRVVAYSCGLMSLPEATVTAAQPPRVPPPMGPSRN